VFYQSPIQIWRVGNKGYVGKVNRQPVRERGTIPVIPHKVNQEGKLKRLAKATYKGATAATSRRQTQELQSDYTKLREDKTKPRFIRRRCRRLYLAHIRPDGLAAFGVFQQ